MSDADTLHYDRGRLRRSAVHLALVVCAIPAVLVLARPAQGEPWLAGGFLLLVLSWLLWRSVRLLGQDAVAARIGPDHLTVRTLFGTTILPLEEVAGSLHISAFRRRPQLAIVVRAPRGRRPTLIWDQLARDEIAGWRARLDRRCGGPAPFTLEGTAT